jgi:DNA-binding transcriptional MerR regulator
VFAIGDFARLGRVSVRMLRHCDAIGLLRPAHVDPATGYRSYRAAQLAELNRIVAFKELGFTLEQVRVADRRRASSGRGNPGGGGTGARSTLECMKSLLAERTLWT